MQLPGSRPHTRSQLAVAVALIFACLGLGLLIGYDQPEYAFAGLVVFALAAVAVCKIGRSV